MAWGNLIQVRCSTKKEAFMRMRDFICKRNGTYDYSTTGIGWTLHDSSYAVDEDTISTGDYVVFYSPGESGDADLYYKLVYESAANDLSMYGYLYWNNTTHLGLHEYGTVNTMTGSDTTSDLWILGHLDSVNIVWTNNLYTIKYLYYMGTTDPLYDGTIAVSTNAESAGSDVLVELTAARPASWVVGTNLFVWDNASIYLTSITAVGASSVTCNLAANMTAGFKLCEDYIPVVNCGTQFYITTKSLMNYKGLFGQSCNAYDSLTNTPAYNSPHPYYGTPFCSKVYIQQNTAEYGLLGKARNILMCPINFSDNGSYLSEEGYSYRCFTAVYSGKYILVRQS